MPDEPFYPAAVRSELLPLPRRLCDHFVYQKNLALERAGVDLSTMATMSPDKAWELYEDAMTKMASIVKKWDADPGVVMEACFAYSRSKRHFNGPQLNMLASKRFLLPAVAYHLDMPKDAAEDLMSRAAMIKRLAKEAALHEATLRRFMQVKWGSDDPALLMDETRAIEFQMITSVPALYRFLMNVLSRPLGLAIIPEVLESLRVNAKHRLWAEERGWSYRGMATYYRVIQPREDTPHENRS